MTPSLTQRCTTLRALHVPGHPLVLPNAWDAASARAVVAAGGAAVATTSGGVAESLGYDDHEGAPREEMLAAAARIARAVDVPVSVDFEAGYGLDAADVVARLHEIGAAGANLEDTDHATGALRPPAVQAERLGAVRAEAERLGYPLVLNARVDVFLASPAVPPSDVLDEAVERSRAYLAAGADCVYPILLLDVDVLRRYVAAVDGPVNVLTWRGGEPVATLADAGAARVSYGSTVFQRSMDRLATELGELLS